jgi:hypothetical protein
MTPPILHLYSPQEPHGDGAIVGTPEGLLLLIEGLLHAVLHGTGHVCTLYTNDRQGYELAIRCIREEQCSEYRLPYAPERSAAVAAGDWWCTPEEETPA